MSPVTSASGWSYYRQPGSIRLVPATSACFWPAVRIILLRMPERHELTKGLLDGAALNGMLTGLTMGLSRDFVGMKQTLSRKMRESAFKELDEFGLKVAVRAGADQKAVLAYVERMAINKEKATGFNELSFEDGRVEALATVAAGLAVKNSFESKVQNVVRASL